MRFLVVLPTYNRAHTLRRAIDSVLAQTHQDWRLIILDDGSTDATLELYRTVRDERISLLHHGVNRGGVAMNEIGMDLACTPGVYDAWTRLGSDDWFLPRKLELDALALEEYGICFGPYRNHPEDNPGELNGPRDARDELLRGEFAASWANIAVRVEVLREVRAIYGNFVDPRIRNMEDYVFNVRAARVADIGWRGMSRDERRVCVGARFESDVPFEVVSDARYNCGPGASDSPQNAEDHRLTAQVLAEDLSNNPRVVGFGRRAVHTIDR